MLDHKTNSQSARRFQRISREQLDALRKAPRSPKVWRELRVDLSNADMVVVTRDSVYLVRDDDTDRRIFATA